MPPGGRSQHAERDARERERGRGYLRPVIVAGVSVWEKAGSAGVGCDGAEKCVSGSEIDDGNCVDES